MIAHSRVLGGVLMAGATGIGVGAQSSTIDTYYYIGGPALVRNDNPYPLEGGYPPGLKLDTPITGIIEIDRSAVPEGESLANLDIFDDPFGGGIYPGDWAYDVVRRAEFDCCNEGNGYFYWGVSFDEHSQLESFSFESGGRSVDIGEEWHVGLGGVHLYRDPYPQSFWVDEFARDYLADLGYKPGTEAYARLLCGSWVSDSHAESCLWNQGGDSGAYPTYASHVWGALLIAGSGSLYSSFSEFTSAYRAALSTPQPPARSYADIAPIPVPAPFLLMLAGVLALGGVARRTTRSRSIRW
jgi:hypothetical protein